MNRIAERELFKLAKKVGYTEEQVFSLIEEAQHQSFEKKEEIEIYGYIVSSFGQRFSVVEGINGEFALDIHPKDLSECFDVTNELLFKLTELLI